MAKLWICARAGSSEPDVEPALVALHLGVLDDHFARIAQVVNTRLRGSMPWKSPWPKPPARRG
jgi:hypothetical protein